MKIRDEARQTEFITEDEMIIKKARIGGMGYSIVAEVTAAEEREAVIDSRRKTLGKMKLELVKTEAQTLGVANDSFINKGEFIEAIINHEFPAPIVETDAA